MINFDKINQYEKYFGEVVEVDSTKKSARIKVKVVTIFDEIPTEYIPYAYPKDLNSSELDLPHVGELVWVEFRNSDIMFPLWYKTRKDTNISNISDDDWVSATILKEKDLSKYGLDGLFSVRYTKTDGLILDLKRNDNTSTFVIRNDNTVLLKNGDTKHIIHLAKDNISLGSENKSEQPAVVGNDNHEALKKLNNEILDLANLMKENLDVMSKLSGSSPYTKHLQVGFRKYGEVVKQKIEQIHKINDNFFPETLSKKVTIDKTNER